MDSIYQRRVRERVATRPRLIPMFTSTHDIPEQVYAYSNDMFVVFNRVRNMYEIHSLDQEGDSYCVTVPFKELDVRAIRHLWRTDIRVHGKRLHEEIEEHNEKLTKVKRRDFHNWVEAVAGETRTMFAKDAFELGL